MIVADGGLVVLATDKSGRFAVMSMKTYMKAGMVHVKDDEDLHEGRDGAHEG